MRQARASAENRGTRASAGVGKGRRWLAAAAMALLTGWVLAFTASNIVLGPLPARAAQLAPYNGRALGKAAQAEMALGSANGIASAVAMARNALRRDPTAVSAVAALGTSAQINGDPEAAARYFRYANRLSRRELQTRLWAIEEAAGRGDIASVLANYDVSMRTSSSVANLFFPTLSGALAEPLVAKQLIPLMATRPIWATDLIRYASENSAEPGATSRFLERARKNGIAVDKESSANLVKSLLDHDEIDEAWRYYASSNPGADRSAVRNGYFTSSPTHISPLDWNLITENGQKSAFLNDGKGGALLQYSAPLDAPGTVLQQTLLLPPGSYRLVTMAGETEQTGNPPSWKITCGADKELASLAVRGGGSENLTIPFTVPPACRLQILKLVVDTDGISAASGEVRFVEIEKSSGK